MKRFEFIEHPADIGVRIRGKNFPDLLVSGARALEYMLEPVIPAENKPIGKNLNIAGTEEEILIGFLNELLFFATVRNLLFRKFLITIEHLKNGYRARIGMKGVRISGCLKEIKSATYHGLAVVKKRKMLEAVVIFDV
jgi:SHS2 domain-containing protein